MPRPSRVIVFFFGANAGDFSAINEIDVILGLCSMDDLARIQNEVTVSA